MLNSFIIPVSESNSGNFPVKKSFNKELLNYTLNFAFNISNY